MIDGALFDALEALARGIRGKQEPFGGIQLILAGQNCSTLSAVSSSGVLSAALLFLYDVDNRFPQKLRVSKP